MSLNDRNDSKDRWGTLELSFDRAFFNWVISRTTFPPISAVGKSTSQTSQTIPYKSNEAFYRVHTPHWTSNKRKEDPPLEQYRREDNYCNNPRKSAKGFERKPIILHH
ncbi:hypothetical protein CDAR_383131 [Caerostris darwini]|uniref:Uncharacterized protein n=1 Tax=Caerostris darwini TaxID=1538125 RepID=A0AAV4NX04_9ARAC|nr:hypothetical protein CDAR_383131 [Caerostris darwini]